MSHAEPFLPMVRTILDIWNNIEHMYVVEGPLSSCVPPEKISLFFWGLRLPHTPTPRVFEFEVASCSKAKYSQKRSTQFNIIQDSIQYNTIQYNTIQYNIQQHEVFQIDDTEQEAIR